MTPNATRTTVIASMNIPFVKDTHILILLVIIINTKASAPLIISHFEFDSFQLQGSIYNFSFISNARRWVCHDLSKHLADSGL
jgi:hypothetical protein